MLSLNLNFAIEYNLVKEEEFKKDLYHVYLEMLIILDKVDCAHVTSSGFVVVVPPGEPYTPYEKILLPFDDLTWILLLIFFSTGFTVVILSGFQSHPH